MSASARHQVPTQTQEESPVLPSPPPPPAAAAHEVDDDRDTDSALGEDATDTTSLASTILRHRHELGRTYHKFRSGENDYWGPNDEQQNDQLDIGHHMFTLLLSNKLYLAPIDEENCRRVLDLGCGTGLWAIDFADSHPNAEVTGVDLSPIQPGWVPPNCNFIIDDITHPWEDPLDYYDFVHIRGLYGSVEDWPALFKQAYDHTKPGGWVQSLEMDIQFASDDGSVTDDNVLLKWSDTFIRAGEVMKKTFMVANQARRWLQDSGFEDVQSQWYKVPVGRWPKNAAMKHIGFWNYHYCYEGCEGWALYILTRVLGWSLEECQVFVAEFRNALQDRKLHAYYSVNVVWGRKPLTATSK